MIIATGRIALIADWCHSLKEKRMIVKSLTDRVHNKFNVSIGEIEDMDVHNSIVLGVACISNSRSHGDSVIQSVINFIENSTEAVVVDISTEIL